MSKDCLKCGKQVTGPAMISLGICFECFNKKRLKLIVDGLGAYCDCGSFINLEKKNYKKCYKCYQANMKKCECGNSFSGKGTKCFNCSKKVKRRMGKYDMGGHSYKETQELYESLKKEDKEKYSNLEDSAMIQVMMPKYESNPKKVYIIMTYIKQTEYFQKLFANNKSIEYIQMKLIEDKKELFIPIVNILYPKFLCGDFCFQLLKS